jgi:uncharacterized protein YbcI
MAWLHGARLKAERRVSAPGSWGPFGPVPTRRRFGLILLFRDGVLDRRGENERPAMSDEQAPEPAENTGYQQSLRAEISREMVRLYKEQFGRGPTKARTDFAGPDIIVCTLENSLTPAEKRLLGFGEHQRLRDTRLYFQHATESEFCSIIERLLQRKVRAFVSGMDVEADVATETFYLVPAEAENDDGGTTSSS